MGVRVVGMGVKNGGKGGYGQRMHRSRAELCRRLSSTGIAQKGGLGGLGGDEERWNDPDSREDRRAESGAEGAPYAVGSVVSVESVGSTVFLACPRRVVPLVMLPLVPVAVGVGVPLPVGVCGDFAFPN